MSNYETKPNTGSLFKNDKKEKDTHPDYKGSALVDGTEYWVSAWINTSKKDGQKYMSISYTAKDESQAKPATKKDASFIPDSDEDQSIPF